MTVPLAPVDPASVEGRPLQVLVDLTDAAVSAVAGRRTRLRIGLSPRGLLGGRTDRVAVTVDDVTFAGLDLASVRVDAARVRIVPGLPPRLRAGPVVVRVTVAQPALDRWLLVGALPVRLAFRSTGLRARVGLGGLRLAEVQAGIEVDRGRLVVTPQRAEILGLGLGTPMLGIPLPLPPLPRATRLERLTVTEGSATVELGVPAIDEPLTPGQARRLSRLLKSPPRRRVRHGA